MQHVENYVLYHYRLEVTHYCTTYKLVEITDAWPRVRWSVKHVLFRISRRLKTPPSHILLRLKGMKDHGCC